MNTMKTERKSKEKYMEYTESTIYGKDKHTCTIKIVYTVPLPMEMFLTL